MREREQRRRRVVVDRKFQFGMTLRIVGLVYVWLVFFAFLTNLGALKTVVFGGTDEAYFAAVDRLSVFVQVFVLPLILTFLCICLQCIWFTRRLAGPITRLREVLKNIREKKLPSEFHVRKQDYFQDLSEEVNRLLTHLRGEIKEFHSVSAELAREGEALLGRGNLEVEDRERLLSIANNSSRLRQMVDGYHLEDAAAAPKPEPVPAEV